MTHPDWFETKPFPHGITRIRETGLGPLHAANIWLVQGRDRVLLIDTGVGVAPLRPVIEALTQLPVVCLLTHAHYDHMGGGWEFADRRAHRLEAAALTHPTPDTALWLGWLTDDCFTRRPAPNFSMAQYQLRPAPPTSEVDDESVVDLGERRLKLVHVPGHSPGLLAVHDPVRHVLFTSDALYEGRMFFDLPCSSQADAAQSIRRLSSLGAQTFHPGHGESFRLSKLPEVTEAAFMAAMEK